MQIGLEDLDPQIAEEMEDRLAAPLHQYLKDNIYFSMTTRYGIPGFMRGFQERDASEAERRAFEYRLQRDRVQASVSRARLISFFLAALAGTIVASVAPVIGILFALFTWLIVLQTTMHQIAYRRPVNALRRNVGVEEMQAVTPLLKLSLFERTYANTLLWLTSREHYADEHALRSTLHDMNGLLANARHLDGQRRQIEEAMKTDDIVDLEGQQAGLHLELARTSDPVVRRALEQSLSFCETRLQNARSLATSLKRLDAQKEVIQQTFGMVQSSLTHSHVAQVQPSVPNIGNIQQSVTDMSQSVEKSVNEMLMLRAE